MNFRHDTYTGGEHYWIEYRNGTHAVRMELPDCYDDNATLFIRNYEQCINWIENVIIENAEYDLHL